MVGRTSDVQGVAYAGGSEDNFAMRNPSSARLLN